jgi:hypothetical protein
MVELTEDIVRIGDLLFRGGAGFDGFYISEDGLTGWDDSPPVRTDSTPRQDADGEYDANVYYSARVLTVSGYCYATSAEQLNQYRNRLMGIDRDSTKVQVTLHGTTTWGYGQLAAAAKFEVEIPGRRAAYQFTRRFVDPFRYGSLRKSSAPGGGFCDVQHWGNAPATSKFLIEGSDANGYVILGPTGRRVEVNTALVSGSPHTFDLATGQLTVDGAVKYGALGEVDLWATYPGKTTSVGLSNTDSSNKLTALTYDTYV